MELQFGVFRFLPTTHAETNANPQTSRDVRHFTHVYLHARIVVDAGDT